MKVHSTNGNCTIRMGKYIIQTETIINIYKYIWYKFKKKNMEYKRIQMKIIRYDNVSWKLFNFNIIKM